MHTRRIGILIALAWAFATPARAQSTPWQPWSGCWTGEREDVQVCVTPGPADTATLRTVVAGQEGDPLVQTIVADGSPRPIEEQDCRGTQQAEWSTDRRRLYTRAALTCGTQEPRQVTGIGFITGDGTWLDIQSIRAAGRDATRVRRFRRAQGPPAPGSDLTLPAVVEAHAKTSAPVVEAALAESNTGLALRSRDLIQLQAAGIPARVINLLIALSYPSKFVVERTARAEPLPLPISGGRPRPGVTDLPYSPFWYDTFYPAYYYSPFAFSYAGWFNPYSVQPAVVYVGGAGGDGSAPPSRPSGEGRVVDGRGYTRVRPREPEPAATGTAGGSAGAPMSTGGSSSSGSAGGTASSSGYSSGGGVAEVAGTLTAAARGVGRRSRDKRDRNA